MPSKPASWLHLIIQEATNAPTTDLTQIENLMRDEIFHSTLDWQTREQLVDAARLALGRLKKEK